MDKSLKKLSRMDLLELLVEATEANESLSMENNELRRSAMAAREQLRQQQRKPVQVAKVGSIAEASLQLSNVFDEAQKAADNYLENVRRVCAERDRESRELAATRIERSRRILEETERRCRSMEQEAQAHAKRLLNDAAGAGRGDTE